MACFSKSDDYIYQFSSLRTAMDNESAVPTWTGSLTLSGPLSTGKRQTQWGFAFSYFSKDELTEVKGEDSCIQGLGLLGH
jgi:hypothetical protein